MKRICGFVLVTVVLGFVMISLSSGTTAAFQISPTRTPVPTLTAQEEADTRDYSFNVIETAFGFEHPYLTDAIAHCVSLQRVRDYGLKIDIYATWFDGYTYMVGDIFPHCILSFRIDTNGNVQEIHLPTHYPSFTDIVYMSNEIQSSTGNIVSNGFADRNGNGLSDIPIWSNNGGNCCLPPMSLLELTPQGEYINITPLGLNVHPVFFYDLDEDGIWEIQSYENAHYEDTVIIRWFDWDGSVYVESTTTREDWYLEQINLNLDAVRAHKFYPYYSLCDAITSSLIQLEIYQALLHYHTIEHLNEGWAEIRQITHWADCQEYFQRRHKKSDSRNLMRFETIVRNLYHMPSSQI